MKYALNNSQRFVVSFQEINEENVYKIGQSIIKSVTVSHLSQLSQYKEYN